ncbi:MAG: hypothetical protein FJZ60_01085 [Chlamydiae bacterium]|nr:hypothetical protein [Chlamydiota bacterium]
MRVAWATDIHLDFITSLEEPIASSKNLDTFCSLLARDNPDAVLLSGDISLAGQLKQHLIALESRLQVPIFFVLGNHDFWGGGIEQVRKSITELSNKSEYLRYLSSTTYTMLSPGVALVGHDGWYDGLNGDPFNENFIMNDWNLISDFSPALRNFSTTNWNMILHIARRQASIAARHIATGIKSVLHQRQPSKIIIVTHVPPFVNPLDCHESGRGKGLYPWYSSKTMGDMLLTAARHNSRVKFEVFCGHVHSGYEGHIMPNLLLRSGMSEYSKPAPHGFYNIVP